MALDSAIQVISRWSSTSENQSYVFTGTRNQIDQYLQAVDEIQLSIHSGTQHHQNTAKSAIQIAMLRLADEMRNLLKVNGDSARNPDSTGYSSTMTDSTASNSYVDDYQYGNALSVAVIDDLQSIARRMTGAGYLLDCKKAYVTERKRCIDVSYQKLYIQKLSSNDARTMEWNSLELIIKAWMKWAKICFRKIFAYEKHLCQKVFVNLCDDTDFDCFLETVNDYVIQLFNVIANLSCIKTASERLFGILELHKTVFDLLPEMNMLFNTQSSESFRTKADQILDELAGAACTAMEKFENDLLNADLSRYSPVDKIHPLSRYVMDYVYKLHQNKQALTQLPLPSPPSISCVEVDFKALEPQPLKRLPFHMNWIVMCLVAKLEVGAKSYKNASHVNFFLMNNFHYLVKKINGQPEVMTMIGDDCFKRVSIKFDQAKAKYLRLTFTKVLSILEDKTSLQKRLKRLNAEFKKLQTSLEVLRVPDFQLLKDLRVSMEEMLVPAYSSFLSQLRSSPSPRLTNDVKFSSAEELKSAILCFLSKSD